MVSFCFTKFTKRVCFLPFTDLFADVGNNAVWNNKNTRKITILLLVENKYQ
jgi:hypothetical protein